MVFDRPWAIATQPLQPWLELLQHIAQILIPI
jgi:hypothetical protein